MQIDSTKAIFERRLTMVGIHWEPFALFMKTKPNKELRTENEELVSDYVVKTLFHDFINVRTLNSIIVSNEVKLKKKV